MENKLKQFIKYFKYGYTGKIDNIIDFTWHKQNKTIENICNNQFICAVTFVTMAVLIYFLCK